nr:RcpC/CpaB family pilus assembly protein [Ornithinimicrobium cryptoxanthini]
MRRSGDYVLPEKAQGLHQLTINLPNPQALGGSIAPGDTVGLFATYELEPPTGWVIGPVGELFWDPGAAQSNDPDADAGDGGADGGGDAGGNEPITFTDLVLDKVLVVRVEGGYVAAPAESGGEGQAQAGDTIHVTVALEPQDAARVIQTMQTGTVWLTLSPEEADDADIDAVVPVAPSRVTGVIE